MIDFNKVMKVAEKIDKDTVLKVGGAILTTTGLINSKLENSSSQQKENKVQVPNLNKKGFPITIDDAEKRLKKSGLEICKIPLTVQDAKSKYRNCRIDEVISSSKKQGTWVFIGDTIDVRYVTEEVIRESQKIFEESELRKQATKEHVKESAKRGAGKLTPKKKLSKTK